MRHFQIAMKFFAALLFAYLCATAWSASPIAIREIAESQAKVEQLNVALSPALAAAKGRIEAFVKALGQNKEKILAKIDELKTKLQQLSKNIVGPSAGKVQHLIRQRMKARIEKALKKLEQLRSKIQKLQ